MGSKSGTHALLIGIGVVVGICLVVCIAFIPRAFRELTHTRTFRMSGESMEPTLYDGDVITVDTSYYRNHPIADGDVIVFRHKEVVLVKRVSAVPGETIAGKDGKLFRNGAPVDEPYLRSPDEVPTTMEPSLDEWTFPARVVPRDQVFVTGDWRSRSLDSRAAEYAPVHTQDVLGKVIYIYSSSHPGQAGRRF